MSEIIAVLWVCIQVIVGINMVTPLLVTAIAAVRTSGRRKKAGGQAVQHQRERDFAVIVTAYEQTTHLNEVVQSLLKMKYSNYLVYIVADNCDTSNLSFNSNSVILLKPPEILKSNTASHFYAIRNFRRAHKYLTIIDSDNLVDTQYLSNMDSAFGRGFLALQGMRAAKNLDSNYACLDAARDQYYHYYDGRLSFNAGSSAALAGSGMSFETKLYRDCLESVNISGAGFDKILQYQIVKKGERIAWCEDAIVYDQKTSGTDQLVKQRARWINTWFRYFGFGFKLILKGLMHRNMNQMIFGMILLRPPLFIFLTLSLAFAAVDIWIQPTALIGWGIAFVLFIVAFYKALAGLNTDRRIYKSLINIPRFVFYQLVSLTKIRKANKYSVATRHFNDRDAA